MSDKIALSISPNFHNKTNLTGKPSAFSHGWKPVEWTPEQIAQHVQAGKAICISLLKDGCRSEKHVVSTQLMFVDVDKGGASVDDLLQYPFIGQHAFLVHPTTNSTLEAPRSRIGFILDRPIDDVPTYKRLLNHLQTYLQQLGIEFDPSCKDASRIFYGSDREGHVVSPEKRLPLSVIEALEVSSPAKPRSKGKLSKRNQSFAQNGAAAGERNSRLFAAACDAAGNGYSEAEAYEQLGSSARESGLEEKEIRATIASAYSKSRTPARPLEGFPIEAGEELEALVVEDRPPTHDEIGNAIMQDWAGNYAFFRSSWHHYEAGLWRSEPKESVQRQIWDKVAMYKELGVSPTKGVKDSILDYLQNQLHIRDDVIDQGNDFLNLPNGLLNLKTLAFEPHRRELYLTTQLPFAYDPSAECPRWKQFLEQVLVTASGTPDQEAIALLQEAIGYSLTADTHLEAAFWLYGPARTGKSTVIEVMKGLSGNMGVGVDFNSLEKNGYQVADIAGKRMVFSTEAKAGAVLAEHIVKQLISGEEITARPIYKGTIRFKSQAKLWWAMNETPRNNDRSAAIYRRLHFIPFNYVIPEGEVDPWLKQKLLEELPGILNWALEGLRRLYQAGKITLCAQSQEALEAYAMENDVEQNFLNDFEWCIRDEAAKTQSSHLYDAYKLWCKRNNQPAKSSTRVARDWERLGLIQEKKGNVYYHGVALTNEAHQWVEGVRSRP
jgi:putative DNA primase/helicase